MVKNKPSKAGDMSLISDPGTKISHTTGQLSLHAPEPMLLKKRSHQNEKTALRNSRKPMYSNKDPTQPKINK